MADHGRRSPGRMNAACAAQRTSWLCPDEAHRERLLDMDARLKRPRALSFVVLAVALLPLGPSIGWWPLGLLVVAALGFALADMVRPRLARPEFAIAGSWVFAQLVIAGAAAATGGPQSKVVLWLAIPIVTLPARFGTRGLFAGVSFTALLIAVVTLAVEPHEVGPPVTATLLPLAALLAVGILSSALMRSDVDHRTEAVIDGLTGMLNRRALTQRFSELEAQSRASGQPVALVIGDIDRFKSVNDEHGHAVGDAALVDIAYRLRKELRAFDLAYRLGGEEFLVVLPGAGPEEAARVAERLREAIAAAPVAGLSLTMSFGLAGSGRAGFDAESLLALADERLYRAKAAGRNRVVTADREPVAVPA
jgi:diguanylate cyclase (GGDEF)-like protein